MSELELKEKIDNNAAGIRAVEEIAEAIKGEVEAVEMSVLKKTFMSNKAIIIQTIALIVTLLGLALAAEHRITVVEKLQAATSAISENQIRVVTVLDGIDKRHALEDQRRVAAAKDSK